MFRCCFVLSCVSKSYMMQFCLIISPCSIQLLPTFMHVLRTFFSSDLLGLFIRSFAISTCIYIDQYYFLSRSFHLISFFKSYYIPSDSNTLAIFCLVCFSYYIIIVRPHTPFLLNLISLCLLLSILHYSSLEIMLLFLF